MAVPIVTLLGMTKRPQAHVRSGNYFVRPSSMTTTFGSSGRNTAVDVLDQGLDQAVAQGPRRASQPLRTNTGGGRLWRHNGTKWGTSREQ